MKRNELKCNSYFQVTLPQKTVNESCDGLAIFLLQQEKIPQGILVIHKIKLGQLDW